MNKWEKACREWLKGCSCADPGKQEECEECTKAFHDHLRGLQDKPNLSVTVRGLQRPIMVPGFYWYFTNHGDAGDFDGPPQVVEVIGDKIYMVGSDVTYSLSDAHGIFSNYLVSCSECHWCGYGNDTVDNFCPKCGHPTSYFYRN